MKRVGVFCGSHPGLRPIYRETAAFVGRGLAERGIGLVYGGGRVGLMGALADAALAAGGSVAGVIPRMLAEREIAHTALTELHVVETMHERKGLMNALSDGFLALPGGYGTLDEIFEAITWMQLGFHDKPCAVLNVDGYFDGLTVFGDRAVADGFVRAEDRARILRGTEPAALLDALIDALRGEASR